MAKTTVPTPVQVATAAKWAGIISAGTVTNAKVVTFKNVERDSKKWRDFATQWKNLYQHVFGDHVPSRKRCRRLLDEARASKISV